MIDLPMQCKAVGLPEPTPEFRFHKTRKWRFDYAWPGHGLAVEIEGGVWTNGRHTRGKGFLGDLIKYNYSAIMGWSLLRFTPEMVTSGEAIKMIENWFSNHKGG